MSSGTVKHKDIVKDGIQNQTEFSINIKCYI
uniref:Uncharacterized protein n=1 Tax=Arundo donax TaxID=35708 RepID=A0A0A8YHU8_ARUDO